MPTGHARTAALLRTGRPGDLPVQRGHSLFGLRWLAGDLACFPRATAGDRAPARMAPAGFARGLSTWPAAPEALNTTTARALVMQLVMQVPGWLQSGETLRIIEDTERSP